MKFHEMQRDFCRILDFRRKGFGRHYYIHLTAVYQCHKLFNSEAACSLNKCIRMGVCVVRPYSIYGGVAWRGGVHGGTSLFQYFYRVYL